MLPASVTRRPDSSEPWFEVTRTVVMESDFGVYAITELVGPDGLLILREKKLLMKDGRRLGQFANPYVK
jgi:hypothetical protein